MQTYKQKRIIKDFRYIYDLNQANFYMEKNHCPIQCGYCDRGFWLKFKDSDELQQVFRDWMDRKIIMKGI